MPLVASNDLERFARELLAAQGLAADHAAQVARTLVWADLRGADTHGVSRLPLYLRWLRSGEMNRTARMQLDSRAPALAVLDADSAPGAVAMAEASRVACQLARDCGTGTVFVRRTTHTGALGFYTQEIARDAMVGVALAASGPNMIYHGAKVPGVSTAPLSIAVPRGGGADPIVFDMASGAVSLGRILQARRTGDPLPDHAAGDADGHPTRDPRQAVAPLALGGPKGSGLALMIEMVCSALSGAGILAAALADRQAAQPHRQNALVLAIDMSRIEPAAVSSCAVEALATAIKALPPADGGAVLLPGERGGREALRRAAAGVPVNAALAAELAALAAPFDLSAPWNQTP